MTEQPRPISAAIGMILTRLVVPLWVLTGAIFKLIENSPRTLPKRTILEIADSAGIDLYVLLAVLLSLEFLFAAIMIFVPRLARLTAIAVLSVFCLILIGEMALGNWKSCGCLGTASPPPWAMLAIDGLLLLGVIFFRARPAPRETGAPWGALAAAIFAVAGTVTSFAIVLPEGRAIDPGPDTSPVVEQPDDGDAPDLAGGAGEGTPTAPSQPPLTGANANPAPKPVPGFWLARDVEQWAGKPWREIELFQYMRRWPKGMDQGLRYITFYGRTCDHCEDMFYMDLINPELASMVTAVQVPENKDGTPDPARWEIPETEAELLDLPAGTDWIMTTPLTVAVQDGIVICAEEGGHEKCMGLE